MSLAQRALRRKLRREPTLRSATTRAKPTRSGVVRGVVEGEKNRPQGRPLQRLNRGFEIRQVSGFYRLEWHGRNLRGRYFGYSVGEEADCFLRRNLWRISGQNSLARLLRLAASNCATKFTAVLCKLRSADG